MATLLSYITSYDSIRFALGVNTETDELPDANMADYLILLRLEEALLDIHEELVDDIATLTALETPTADEQKLLNASKLFCTYQAAAFVADAAPNMFPQTITDGKASMKRGSDQESVVDRVWGNAKKFKDILAQRYAIYKGETPVTSSLPVYCSSSARDSDPILGT